MTRRFARALDLSNADERLLERFWTKVDRRGPDECWEWLAHRKPSGYGQFTLRKGCFITASRVALALKLGQLGAGIVACHACDNPPCCNPGHLFAGTQSDNTLDSVAKGRANRSRGAAHRDARLDEDSIRAIRSAPYRRGLMSEMAREFGVNHNTIRAIRAGRTWRHVA